MSKTSTQIEILKLIKSTKLPTIKYYSPSSWREEHENGDKLITLLTAQKFEKASIFLDSNKIMGSIDFTRTDPKQNTALHLAVKNNQFDLVKKIVEAGANIYVINSESQTPLSIANQMQFKEVVDYLKKESADLTGDNEAEEDDNNDHENNSFSLQDEEIEQSDNLIAKDDNSDGENDSSPLQDEEVGIFVDSDEEIEVRVSGDLDKDLYEE